MESLSRRRLTAALAARQLLLERASLSPADAIRRLTPLQGQHPPAPFIALAARLEGFSRAALERDIEARRVVKTTIMRQTLHVAEAGDYPAYAQLVRQTRLRAWRKRWRLDEEKVIAELGAWLSEPRRNTEIRDRMAAYDGVPDDPYNPILLARTLLPLVQLPPAGFYEDTRRQTLFVKDPRPLPDLADAAALVLRRYLEAFGPAQRRDVAAWAGATQTDFAGAWERVETVSYRDEAGRELIDLPGRPLPPESTPLPPRFLSHWDQALLAYQDRERIMPPEVAPLKLTLSGSPTVLVDGRVAASWDLRREGDGLRVEIEPHVDIARSAHAAIREEAMRTARICEPDAQRVEVTGI